MSKCGRFAAVYLRAISLIIDLLDLEQEKKKKKGVKRHFPYTS